MAGLYRRGPVKRRTATATARRNKLTIQSFNCPAHTRPAGFMPRISQPAAHLAVAVEPLGGPVELKREVHERAGRNVEFNVLEPDHILPARLSRPDAGTSATPRSGSHLDALGPPARRLAHTQEGCNA